MRHDTTGARWGRPVAVWSLVLLLAVGALLCALGALLPVPDAPVVADAIVAVVGGVLAVVLWSTGARTPNWLLHVCVAVAVVATTVIVASAATGEGAVSAAVTYVWLSMYAAMTMTRRVRRTVVAASLVGLAVGLTWSIGTVNAALAWVVLATSCAVASEVLGNQHRLLRALATTDPLTGLLNRAGLHQVGRRELADAARTGSPVALVVIDLDGFKVVNDRDGHAAGDALLASLADHWRGQLRPRDTVARTGGDEFVLLLPGTTVEEAVQLLDRLERSAPVGWTAGVVELAGADDLDPGLRRADAEMYRRKAARRGASPSAGDAAPVASDAVTGAP